MSEGGREGGREGGEGVSERDTGRDVYAHEPTRDKRKIMLLSRVCHIAKVFKQSFWMSAWGSRTPKRTTLWSNSRAIRRQG